MAGTDRGRKEEPGAAEPAPAGPAIILVEPQLGENIGAAARAMLNCGLRDLRLVKPREAWPNPRATVMASGAVSVLRAASLHPTTLDAAGSLTQLFATTARRRDFAKRVLTPRAAAARMRAHAAAGGRPGVLFGPERAGLVNDDVAMCDAMIQVPLNPAFASLNLAQAVLLIGYEWRLAGDDATPGQELASTSPAATLADREYFYRRLERELEAGGFLYPPDLAPTIRRNLRNLFNRTGLTDQELRTLHGVLTTLLRRPPDSG